ncbi:MAG: hypothetical protein V1746_06225 [bacterium]
MEFELNECPRCRRKTRISVHQSCQNTLNNGSLCGFSFSDRNRTIREAEYKHALIEPPAYVADKQGISFNPNVKLYRKYREQTLASGNLFWDSRNEYPFAYYTPSGSMAIAVHCSDYFRIPVSGFKMPLNSKPQNMHGHYANLSNDRDTFVATFCGTVFGYPGILHPTQHYITQSGKLIAAWDRAANFFIVI